MSRRKVTTLTDAQLFTRLLDLPKRLVDDELNDLVRELYVRWRTYGGAFSCPPAKNKKKVEKNEQQ